MNFRQNDIIFLLGAGASVNAGIPTSFNTIEEVEMLLKEDRDWKQYKKLYDFIKSTIYHGDGINGLFASQVNYNIERLVSTLSELEKNERHVIFAFILGWHYLLIENAGVNFKNISQLKQKIVGRLKEKWILLDNYKKASYYRNFIEFKKEYQYPLRVFSLNYDLCFERACSQANIERGFDDERLLDVKRFEDDDNVSIDFFLYKIHGSIDWKKNEYGLLTYSDEAGNISINELEIIFGTNYKLQYLDPYLFSIYEFRKYCLRAKLIVVIGYSFGDEHVNGIIGQALGNDRERKILNVSRSHNLEKKKQEIADKINLSENSRIEIAQMSAKNFLEQKLNINYLSSFFSTQESIFDE
ncbi:MAG: SIR2 family protein [Xenococcaceae cyanobacterium]